MGQISDIRNPWRQLLLSQPAKFRDVQFHVESGNRASGRRTVVHEYPKRNEPYAEDMGVHARRFAISGYLIYRINPPLGQAQYTIQRQRLVKALEDDDIGTLIHPTLCAGGMQVMCERYSMAESRERGGYTQFDMQFVQSGSPGNSQNIVDTLSIVRSSAGNAEQAAVTAADSVINGVNRASSTVMIAPFQPNAAERLVIEALAVITREALRN
jgi:prophage DNA circulation protein